MDFAPDEEIRKIPDLLQDLFDHVLYDEEPFFVSDEATIWDVSVATPEELLKRCSKYYRRPISMEDLKQPLWKLLTLLNAGRPSGGEGKP